MCPPKDGTADGSGSHRRGWVSGKTPSESSPPSTPGWAETSSVNGGSQPLSQFQLSAKEKGTHWLSAEIMP